MVGGWATAGEREGGYGGGFGAEVAEVLGRAVVEWGGGRTTDLMGLGVTGLKSGLWC